MSKLGKEGQNGHFWICFKWKKTKECIVLVFSKSKRDQNVKIRGALTVRFEIRF